MNENVHVGHRSRMRRKFSEYGDRFFDDYELLEMLLYFSIPVRDTNPISKKLLSHFGSLDAVLSATPEQLMQVDGIGKKTADVISLAGMCRKMPDKERGADVFLDTYEACGEYLARALGSREDFVTVVMSFDSRMRLISFDEAYHLDYSSGGIKPDVIADTLIRNRASVAIVAHNHPHGPFYPTEGDLQTNKVISSALRELGIVMAEHYVICGERYVGFMNHINTAFAQSWAVDKFYKSKKQT